MDPLKLPLEELLYLRLGKFLDQLDERKVPELYRMLIDQVDRAILRQALERSEGQLQRAAELLDVDRNTLSRKVRRLKLDGTGKPLAAGASGGATERDEG